MGNKNTDPSIWNKEWFMALSPIHKLLLKYIFEMCDNAGVWPINYRLASTHIGKTITNADINALGNKVEFIRADKLFLPWYLNFQCGGPLMHIPRGSKKPNNFHINIFNLIIKHGLANRLNEEGYINNSGAHEGLPSPSCAPIEEKSIYIEEQEKRKEEGGSGETTGTFKISDLEKYFTESQAWAEKTCMALGIKLPELKEWQTKFIALQTATTEVWMNQKDAITHFVNWTKKELKSPNNRTNGQSIAEKAKRGL